MILKEEYNNLSHETCFKRIWTHIKCEPDKFGFQREQFAYSNSQACKKCPHKAKCCGNRNHRTITRYSHELLDLAEQNMESDENKEEY